MHLHDDIGDTHFEGRYLVLVDKSFSSSTGTGTADNPRSHVLSIDYRYLDAKSELQRMFGNEVLMTENRAQKGPRTRPRGRGGTKLSLTGSSRMETRQHHGVSMEVDRQNKNSSPQMTVFKYVHDIVYQKHQIRFDAAMDRRDQQGILELLHSGPGHVDTLLQMAGLFRSQEDYSYADDLVQKAIMEMEYYVHHQCNYSVPNSTLDYNRMENRGLFIALFYHMLSVTRRRCFRAGLELCKLLMRLSADGDDPLAALLVADFYALRCHEYVWLREYYHLANSLKNLEMLPNFAFSVPLACFYLSKGGGNTEAHKSLKNRLTESTSGLTSADFRREADEMLQRALLIFPHMLSKLMEANNIKPDEAVLKHQLFYNNTKYK